jgi:hypothetical protein
MKAIRFHQHGGRRRGRERVTFLLAAAADAQRRMEQSGQFGNVGLEV